MVGITKEGRWLLYTGPVEDILSGAWEQGPVTPGLPLPRPLCPRAGGPAGRQGRNHPCGCDFPRPAREKWGGRHHPGAVPALSASPMWAATPSPPPSCMDKAVTHTLCSPRRTSSRPTTCGSYADRFDAAPDTIKKKIQARLDFPVFVKPASAGSSVGVSKVERFRGPGRGHPQGLPGRTRKWWWKRASRGQEVEVRRAGQPGLRTPPSWGRSAPRPSSTTTTTSMSTAPASCTSPPGMAEEVGGEDPPDRRAGLPAAGGARGLTRVDFFRHRRGPPGGLERTLTPCRGSPPSACTPSCGWPWACPTGSCWISSSSWPCRRAGQDRP